MFSETSNRTFISLLVAMLSMITGAVLFFLRIGEVLNTPWLLVLVPMCVALALIIFESCVAGKE